MGPGALGVLVMSYLAETWRNIGIGWGETNHISASWTAKIQDISDGV
jgi:hypothetical protein